MYNIHSILLYCILFFDIICTFIRLFQFVAIFYLCLCLYLYLNFCYYLFTYVYIYIHVYIHCETYVYIYICTYIYNMYLYISIKSIQIISYHITFISYYILSYYILFYDKNIYIPVYPLNCIDINGDFRVGDTTKLQPTNPGCSGDVQGASQTSMPMDSHISCTSFEVTQLSIILGV